MFFRIEKSPNKLVEELIELLNLALSKLNIAENYLRNRELKSEILTYSLLTSLMNTVITSNSMAIIYYRSAMKDLEKAYKKTVKYVKRTHRDISVLYFQNVLKELEKIIKAPMENMEELKVAIRNITSTLYEIKTKLSRIR